LHELLHPNISEDRYWLAVSTDSRLNHFCWYLWLSI